ncbi:MAG: hypothetical protein IJ955_10245, partial [Oscillospiraceae bacterium]|nr:hypothetical protein [Oscillospiraceae bacterium]
DEKKAQERKKAARKYQVPTQTHAQRVLRAIDAAGLTDDVKIPWERWDSYSVGTIRQWAEGNFEDSDDRWYSVRLTPESLYNAYKCCELLGCSADYLLGFTDELNPQKAESPAEGWLSLKWIDGRENPQTVGQRAVGQFIIDNRIDPVEEIVAWNGEQWLFDDYGVEVEGTCLWWFPIPGEDESWTD